MYNVFCCLLFIFYTIISLLYAFNIQKLLHKIKYTLKNAINMQSWVNFAVLCWLLIFRV